MSKPMTWAMVTALLTGVGPLSAQSRSHLLMISGLSGEPSFAASFMAVGSALRDAASQWRWADDHVIWLAEDTTADRRIDGRSTREGIAAAFRQLQQQSGSGDTVLVLLLGHGSGAGSGSRLSVPGADPTAAEYVRWLDRLAGRVVTVVVGASAGGDFVPLLSRPGRVVISATRSATERNESVFASRWVQGLSTGEADADKDGRISALESFNYAAAAVARHYADDHRLQTEHAVLDDDGDGQGSATPGTAAGDGLLARQITFGGAAPPTDPRAVPLLAERATLERQIEDLRRQKETLAEAVYLDRLEALLVRMAETTAELDRLRAAGTP